MELKHLRLRISNGRTETHKLSGSLTEKMTDWLVQWSGFLLCTSLTLQGHYQELVSYKLCQSVVCFFVEKESASVFVALSFHMIICLIRLTSGCAPWGVSLICCPLLFDSRNKANAPLPSHVFAVIIGCPLMEWLTPEPLVSLTFQCTRFRPRCLTFHRIHCVARTHVYEHVAWR